MRLFKENLDVTFSKFRNKFQFVNAPYESPLYLEVISFSSKKKCTLNERDLTKEVQLQH